MTRKKSRSYIGITERVKDQLHTLFGSDVPSFAGILWKTSQKGALGDIVRKNHQRVVTVKASVYETKIIGAVARKQVMALLENAKRFQAKDMPGPAGFFWGPGHRIRLPEKRRK